MSSIDKFTITSPYNYNDMSYDPSSVPDPKKPSPALFFEICYTPFFSNPIPADRSPSLKGHLPLSLLVILILMFFSRCGRLRIPKMTPVTLPPLPLTQAKHRPRNGNVVRFRTVTLPPLPLTQAKHRPRKLNVHISRECAVNVIRKDS
ncbi:MAG TPA: hypothetical protein VLE95_06920 [Chlamydiales bacterium]|nr:hypothetical protein [Chlamydiales bacterium]